MTDRGVIHAWLTIFIHVIVYASERGSGERFHGSIDIGTDEQERGVTMKGTGVLVYSEHDEADGNDFQPHLINFIDSFGHADFSSEVTAALRKNTDCAVIVVDVIEEWTWADTIDEDGALEKTPKWHLMERFLFLVYQLSSKSTSLYPHSLSPNTTREGVWRK